MTRRLSLAFLSAVVVYALSVVSSPPALAVNCDLNVCINACTKKCAIPGCACLVWCKQSIKVHKKKGECKA
jgi:predicted carbohydrate-binding protein with CBM5 and CBM33 domain